MKISLNWLQTHFEDKLPTPEKLADISNFHVFEVESIEKADNDTVIDFKVLPDRAHYALSHKGIASEMAVLADLKSKPREIKNIESVKTSRDLKIKVADPKFCPRYMGRVVENVKVSESPKWLSERLEAIGARSINSVVDATNYVMFDMGQPLHAFDADKVKGAIQVRPAKKGETITTLDGREVELGPEDSVIADDEGPLAIAGVKGGTKAEVTMQTKNIIIEAANFNATAVRKTSVRVNIKNDAVKRYENDITPVYAEEGMNQVSALISELSPGTKFGKVVDEYPNPVRPWPLSISPETINLRLGSKIPEKTMVEILEKLGMGVAKDKSVLKLTIPCHRLDLKISEDIVEEVGRVYGYDRIEAVPLPKAEAKPEFNKTFYWREKVRNLLFDFGFSETYLYSLVAKGDYEVLHPLALDKAFLRKDLSDSLVKVVHDGALNADLLGLNAIKVFEIGKVFLKRDKEVTRLALGAEQVKKVKGINGDKLVSEAVKALEKELGVPLNGKIVGKGIVFSVEFDLDEIISKLPEPKDYSDLKLGPAPKIQYKKFSPYPFIVRDIAVFVPEAVSSDQVWDSISKGLKNAGATPLVARHSLFDVFKKEGKISYAFRMVFQAPDRTLRDEEANKFMESIYGEMKANTWEVR